MNLTPPVAERRPTTRIVHGVRLDDDYAWLKAGNWQAVLRDPTMLPPDIRTYLEAENAYAEASLAPTAELQATLLAEMKGRLKDDDSGVPQPDGPYAYYSRFRAGGQHRLHCRKPREGGAETVLLDGDVSATGKTFFKMGPVVHAPGHRLLAWSADEQGSEYHTVRLSDIEAGAMLDDAVPDTTGAVVWSLDGATFLYVRVDENHRPSRVFRHRLGQRVSDDMLLYEEADAGMFVDIGRTQSGRYAVISVHDHETGEVHLVDLADDHASPVLVAPRRTGIQVSVDHAADRLVILTNADGAEDFTIATARVSDTGRQDWRIVEAHRQGRLILDIAAFDDWLVRLERENGLPRIVVRQWETGEEHAIAFEEEAYSLDMQAGFEAATDTLRFVYASMTTPAEMFDYDMRTRTRVLLKRQDVPSGHDPAAYVTRRLFARAPDGEPVPVSVLYARNTPLDGSAPCLLYGYGAYGIAMPAGFSTTALSLVDRGFVYAVAHVRGGTERGWRWYRDGKLAQKPNSFSDFVAAGRHLVQIGFTGAGRIVAHGGSAGGLLMGAVANQAPDLFGAILAEVPFVDVLTTMLDSELPLTPPEWPEWGNPIESPEAFQTIRGYSPVDNVAAQAYPAMLVLAGLTDPRVTYWEPAKWVARLRALKTDENPLLFRVNMDAGHAGASGRYDRLKEVALVQAFAITRMGARAAGP